MNTVTDVRLVVASNRVIVPRNREVAPGGLAVGLRSVLSVHRGVWFGWDGQQVARPPVLAQRVSQDGVDYVTLPLSHDDYSDYYQGFANRVLWPLMHYRLELLRYRRRYYEAYRRVNESFAEHLATLLHPDTLLWVHDYHFVPMAAELRTRGYNGRIGLFLHVPFPPLDILRCMPPYRDFLRWFTAYDLVGFQTEFDRSAFIDAARWAIDADCVGKQLVYDARSVDTDVFPIGVDTNEIAEQARRGRASRRLRTFESGLEGRRLIIGADRLDYSKGLVERCQAYHYLLANHPQLHGDVVYLQVAEPSRTEVPEYQEIHHRLDQAAGQIIGDFARFDWTPMRYLSHRMQRSTLLAFLSVARVALVTPLRDGMNLVAKEFIAAQDPSDPGVLVLSELAGASSQLREALLVNPYDVEGVAEAIAEALVMPLAERRRRWQALFETVRCNDVFNWSTQYLNALSGSATGAAGCSVKAGKKSDDHSCPDKHGRQGA